jgi:hypothetical protein
MVMKTQIAVLVFILIFAVAMISGLAAYPALPEKNRFPRECGRRSG